MTSVLRNVACVKHAGPGLQDMASGSRPSALHTGDPGLVSGICISVIGLTFGAWVCTLPAAANAMTHAGLEGAGTGRGLEGSVHWSDAEGAQGCSSMCHCAGIV